MRRVILIIFIGLFAVGIFLGWRTIRKSNTLASLHPQESTFFTKNLSIKYDSIIGKLEERIAAGVGIDVAKKEIFWEKNPKKLCKIASLTKLMVILIVMEKIKKGEIQLIDTVTVTAEASKIGGSQVYLMEGEKFLLEDLLKAMMITSANDASYLVAQYIGGTEENFVKMMNKKAREMGLKYTYFVNSTGLPPDEGPHNVSNSLDIAKIAFQVIKYPEVMRWASTKVDSFRDGEFVLYTRNRLLWRYSFVDGLKTGYYREAGWNLVATSLKNEKKVMAIILGSKSRRIRDKIAKLLLTYALYFL
jgi:D-alanyl-D-alanine carboxypeptidase (penicillin-binding protein 5/6)